MAIILYGEFDRVEGGHLFDGCWAGLLRGFVEDLSWCALSDGHDCWIPGGRSLGMHGCDARPLAPSAQSNSMMLADSLAETL
jgi:hypothetical protein